eukprot:TRINITY_DN7880_c0_g2_i2.p1 TRINITY_DN7880_c0_g2~~TRINITY_DN7880_c0_g2_i2.p1  ORF type:complete len:302 (+),score=72.46 TRINITY_DN7880_c0_g2_i2:320-1225(+)
MRPNCTVWKGIKADCMRKLIGSSESKICTYSRFEAKHELSKETESRLLKERKNELEHKEDLLKEREIKCKEQEVTLKDMDEENVKRSKRYEELYNNYKELEGKYNARNTEFEVLSKTAERIQSLLAAKEQENKLLLERLDMAERGYEIEKQQTAEQKADYRTTTSNLKSQVEEYKEDLERVRSYYAEAERERSEAASYKFSQAKSEYEESLAKKKLKIKKLKNTLNDEAEPKDSGLTQEKENAEESDGSVLCGPEYALQKKRWRQLEHETQMLKTDVQAVVAPADPLGLPSDPDAGVEYKC